MGRTVTRVDIDNLIVKFKNLHDNFQSLFLVTVRRLTSISLSDIYTHLNEEVGRHILRSLKF